MGKPAALRECPFCHDGVPRFVRARDRIAIRCDCTASVFAFITSKPTREEVRADVANKWNRRKADG